jgi:hypothetical protein
MWQVLGGENVDVYRVSVEKLGGKRPIGRLRHRLEDNIKMDLKAIGGPVWTGFIGLRIGTGGYLL